MTEPPENPRPPEDPRPAGGEWESPDPKAPAEPAATPAPQQPPPYQGTYGGAPPGQPGGLPHAPPVQQPGYGPPGQPQPGYGAPGYGPPGHHGVPEDMYAGRGARLGAGILDGLIVGILGLPVVLSSIRWDKMQDSVDSGEPITDPMDLYNIPRLVIGYAIVALVGLAYYTIMHAKWGQTLGKKAVGIRVVKAADLSAVSWGQALGRQLFVYVITFATSIINFLAPAAGILGLVGMLDNAWILWDQRRQAVHDKVAGTVVVKALPWVRNPYARS